jgi:hypothetical protein
MNAVVTIGAMPSAATATTPARIANASGALPVRGRLSAGRRGATM